MGKELFFTIIGVVFALFVVVGGAYWGMTIQCDQRTVSFEDHRFGLFSGCMVKHRGRWLPLDNIRGFDDKG